MKFKTAVATLLVSSASTNAINIEQVLPSIKNIPRALQEYYWYYFDKNVQTMDAHNGTGIDPNGECVCAAETELVLDSNEERRGELLDAIRTEMLETADSSNEDLVNLLNQFADICGQDGMGMTLLADIEFSQCGGESSGFNYANYPACVSTMCGGTEGDFNTTSEVIALQVSPVDDCDDFAVSSYTFFNLPPKESCQIVIPLEPGPSEDDQVVVDDEVKEENITSVENVTDAPSHTPTNSPTSYYGTDDNTDDEIPLPPGVSMECQQDFAEVFPEFYATSFTLITLQVTNLVGPVDNEFIFEKEKHAKEFDLYTSNCTDSLGTTFYASWMYGEACLEDDENLNSMKYTHVPVCLPTSCGYHASKALMEILIEGDNDLCEVNVSIDESVPDEDDSSKSTKSSKSSTKETKSSSKKAFKSVKSAKTVKTVKKEKKIKVPKSGISGGKLIDGQCQVEMMGLYGNEMGVDPAMNLIRQYVFDTLMECSDPDDALQFCEYNGNETALEEFVYGCESLNGTAVQTDWRITDVCADINATAMTDSIGMWECIPNVCSETDAINFFHTIYFSPVDPSCYAEVSFAHMHSGANMVKSAKGSSGVIGSTKITKAGGTSTAKKMKKMKKAAKAGDVTSKMSKAEGSSSSASSLPKKMKKVKVVKSSSVGTETVPVPSTMSLGTATEKIMKKNPKALRLFKSEHEANKG